MPSSDASVAISRLLHRRGLALAGAGLTAACAAGGLIAWPVGFGVLALLAFGLAVFPERVGEGRSEAGRADHDWEAEQRAAAAEAEVQRRITEAKDTVWKAAVGALADPFMVVDANGRVLHANASLRELFPKAAPGLPMTHVIRSPELLDAIELARKDRVRINVALEDRVPVRRKLSAWVTPVEAGSEPDAASVTIVLRDVSEEERLAQMRADFIANASHELRTPLASLRGFVETLQGPARDDEKARERFLAIMATQAARMTRLIDDLLSLSRIEMRAHVPPRGEVDLNEVANFVVQSLEPVASDFEVTLSCEPAAEPAIVRADREELVQVAQNLVHNAIKYGKEGGHVIVRVGEDPRTGFGRPRIALSVVDDGPGIAAEHLPRLTERFYRVNAAVSREKGGTGLGLAIVKNIVNRHRGDLRVTSQVGQGSSFVVVLDRLAAGSSGREQQSANN